MSGWSFCGYLQLALDSLPFDRLVFVLIIKSNPNRQVRRSLKGLALLFSWQWVGFSRSIR